MNQEIYNRLINKFLSEFRLCKSIPAEIQHLCGGSRLTIGTSWYNWADSWFERSYSQTKSAAKCTYNPFQIKRAVEGFRDQFKSIEWNTK